MNMQEHAFANIYHCFCTMRSIGLNTRSCILLLFLVKNSLFIKSLPGVSDMFYGLSNLILKNCWSWKCFLAYLHCGIGIVWFGSILWGSVNVELDIWPWENWKIEAVSHDRYWLSRNHNVVFKNYDNVFVATLEWWIGIMIVRFCECWIGYLNSMKCWALKSIHSYNCWWFNLMKER